MLPVDVQPVTSARAGGAVSATSHATTRDAQRSTAHGRRSAPPEPRAMAALTSIGVTSALLGPCCGASPALPAVERHQPHPLLHLDRLVCAARPASNVPHDDGTSTGPAQ